MTVPISKKEKREQFTNSLPQCDELPKHHTIEHAIDQYLMSLYSYYQQKHTVDSYKALTTLESYSSEEIGNNRKNQQLFVNKIRNNNNYRLIEQKSKNGDVSFYHIQSKDFLETAKKENPNNRIRLYINLKRKNIAAFSSELASQLGNSSFYFKFIADEELDKSNRAESIVVYTTIDKINTIIQAINNIQAKNPELVKNTRGVNPFMKRINKFTGYAPEVDGTYVDENNQKTEINKSYNSLLSKVLEDSYTSAAKEIIARDKDLTLSTGGQIFKDSSSYIRLYPAISERHNNELISLMKAKIGKAMERNQRLDIELESNNELGRN